MTSKTTTFLLNFKGKPMFDKVQILDKQKLSDKSNTSKKEKPKSKRLTQKLSKTLIDNIIKDSKKENEPNRASKEQNKPRKSLPPKHAKS